MSGEDGAFDPLALSAHLGVDQATVMRRLASLPASEGGAADHAPQSSLSGPVGLVSCDASGTLLLRRPIEGFALPRFGTACPRWPLFAALSRPMTPIRRTVRQSGQGGRLFLTYAIAQPVGRTDYNADPMFEAHMLIVPLRAPVPVARDHTASGADQDPREVGVSCRICPAQGCDGRREPSILADGF